MTKIMKYLTRRQWVWIGICILFIVGQVWLDLKMPDYMSAITTLVQTEGSSMHDILIQGVYMLLCAFGSMMFSIIVGYFAAKTAAGLAQTLRGKVFDKTISFSLEEIDRFSTASLISRSTNDITQIQNIIAMGLQMAVKAPIMAVWAVMKIASKDYWQWTATTAVSVFILMIVLAIIIIFALPRFKKIQGLTDNLNRITREHLTGIRVVRAYNAEQYQENKFAKANDEVTETNMTANRVMALMSPTMTLISSGLTLVVYWFGAYIIEAAGVTEKLGVFSDMVVFSNYAIQVIQAFMMLNMIFIMLPRAQVSARRICEVLETRSRIQDGVCHPSTAKQGYIEFKDVSFRYPGASADTLNNISFTAGKGETVALIGATGCGKTTLINLIPRFYDVTHGQVLVDGEDVRDYPQKELHKLIGYVSQKAVLFSGTVTSNIAFGDNGKGTIHADDVREAVSVAQATEFVERMDGTYDAPIAQGGTNVSGGQKQRLSIARAVARKPEILIFDDSFSALDYKTDRTLRSTLQKKTKDTTKLIVAQRISTIKDANQILVLDHGKIVGKGTHKELLQNCPEYLEIAQSQLSKEEIDNG